MNFVKVICVLLISLNFYSCKKDKPETLNDKPETPNVILIYADDLGRGLLSYEGQKIIKTPNIDRLAEKGIRFENSYGCHYCAPARASMLSGYHDCHTDKWQISTAGVYSEIPEGVTTDMVEEKLNEQFDKTPEEELFMAEVFQKAGYVTGEIGKLDWGFATTHKRLKRHGWDYHYGYYDHQRCHGFYPPFLFENGEKVPIEGNTRDDCGKRSDLWDMTGKKTYSQNLFLEKIIGFLRKNKNEKFFLYHPTQLPHGPISIPEIHPDFKDNPDLNEVEKAYASMVKMLDEHVGIIIDELKKLGIYENTMVIFTGDNGHEIYYGNKGKGMFDNINTKLYSDLVGDVFNGNDGMAGLKRDNWEGGVRVPLIYHWPNHIEGGKVIDQVVANYDLLPTFADMLGVQVPQNKDGISYFPVLFGKESSKHEYVVFNSKMGPALVTEEGWKLRYYKEVDIYQLYFLPDDYIEANNLAELYPEKVKALKDKLLKECGGEVAPAESRLPKISFD